jgi:hypothetical protein
LTGNRGKRSKQKRNLHHRSKGGIVERIRSVVTSSKGHLFFLFNASGISFYGSLYQFLAILGRAEGLPTDMLVPGLIFSGARAIVWGIYHYGQALDQWLRERQGRTDAKAVDILWLRFLTTIAASSVLTAGFGYFTTGHSMVPSFLLVIYSLIIVINTTQTLITGYRKWKANRMAYLQKSLGLTEGRQLYEDTMKLLKRLGPEELDELRRLLQEEQSRNRLRSGLANLVLQGIVIAIITSVAKEIMLRVLGL